MLHTAVIIMLLLFQLLIILLKIINNKLHQKIKLLQQVEHVVPNTFETVSWCNLARTGGLSFAKSYLMACPVKSFL